MRILEQTALILGVKSEQSIQDRAIELQAELRTVQQERDSRIQQIEAGWKRREAEAVSVQVALQAECDSLRADVARLTGERDKWLNNFNRSEQFQNGPTKRAEHAEQQMTALRASIEQLRRYDFCVDRRQFVNAADEVRTSIESDPTGEYVKYVDLSALLAAIKEPATP